MRCPKCGHKNRDDEAFCVRCGIEMKAYQRDIMEQEQKPALGLAAPVPTHPKAAPPPESPGPQCPKCSGPMQRGVMLAPAGGLLGGVRWDAVDGIDVWGLKGEMLASSSLMANSIRMPGFRCPKCRVLVLTY